MRPHNWLNNLIKFPQNLDQIRAYLTEGEKPKNPKLTKKKLKEFSLTLDRLFFQGMLVLESPEQVEQTLQQEYEDVGVGMGIPSFYRYLTHHYIGITRDMVAEFLKKQVTYQLSVKPYIKKTNQPHINHGNRPMGHLCMDLADMRAFKVPHKAYLLVVIDSFTRYLWLRVLGRKTKTAVGNALREIFEEEGSPSVLHSDNGGEFQQEELSEEFGFTQVFSKPFSPESNPIAEGTIKIMRKWLNAFMVKNDTRNWHTFVPDVASIWNRTPHGGSKYTPEFLHKSDAEDVGEDHAEAVEEIRERARKRVERNRTAELVVGDHVRCSLIASVNRYRNIAKTNKVDNIKTHPVRWSARIYKVKSIIEPDHEIGKKRYTLETKNGAVYKNGARFFASELQKVGEDAEDVDPQIRRRLNRDPEIKPEKPKPRNDGERRRPPTPPPREPSRRERRAPRHHEDYEEFSDHDDDGDEPPPPPPRRRRNPAPAPAPQRRTGRERRVSTRLNDYVVG